MAKPQSPVGLVRFLVVVLFAMVAAGSWDIWWHGAVGRDSFAEPPHLLLYIASVLAIGASAIGWHRYRDRAWRRISLALLAVPLAAPADELWHRLFGAEDLSSALIAWSPPHLLMVAGIFAGLWLLFPKLENDRLGRQFLGSLAIAASAALLAFVTMPLHPLGPYRLWGLWGAIPVAAVLAGLLIASHSLVGGFGRATTVGAFFGLLHVTWYHWGSAPGVIVPFHAHPPAWLLVGSVLAMAAFIDIARKLPEDALGGAAGFIFGAILFGLVSSFDQEFQLAARDVVAAIAASAIGGVVGGFLSRRFAPR